MGYIGFWCISFPMLNLLTTEKSVNFFPTFLFFQNLESQNTPVDINWSANEVHVDALKKT